MDDLVIRGGGILDPTSPSVPLRGSSRESSSPSTEPGQLQDGAQRREAMGARVPAGDPRPHVSRDPGLGENEGFQFKPFMAPAPAWRGHLLRVMSGGTGPEPNRP
jgi:hypothetical protein